MYGSNIHFRIRNGCSWDTVFFFFRWKAHVVRVILRIDHTGLWFTTDENRKLSAHQLHCHWWHRMLSWRQPSEPSMTTKDISWRLSVSGYWFKMMFLLDCMFVIWLPSLIPVCKITLVKNWFEYKIEAFSDEILYSTCSLIKRLFFSEWLSILLSKWRD